MILVTNKRYPVKVSWSVGNTDNLWNEICIEVIEKFGMPGERYSTELTNNWIIFNFKTAEDQLMAKLTLGDLEFN